MNGPESMLARFHLNPGQVIFAQSPLLVTTILGSCVSVVMFHPRTLVGAMCHGLLPLCRCEEAKQDRHCHDCFRFVDCSIRYMLNEFEKQNIPTKELMVKLFGGADMFRTGQARTVGSQNIDVAREVLQNRKMRISSEDVGGDQGRKLLFYTHTGEVRLKRLGKNRERYRELQEELELYRQIS